VNGGGFVKLRNAVGAGLISVSAVAGLVSPAYAAARPAAAKADKCSVRVNIPHPHARQTETLTVASTVAGTTVQVTIKYKTVTHVWKFKTPKGAKTAYKFGVGNPTKGYKVTLAGKVTAGPKGYATGSTCSTYFVPA
jgi:hypothetical protein